MLLCKHLFSQASQMFNSAIRALTYYMISSPFFMEKTCRLNKTSQKASDAFYTICIQMDCVIKYTASCSK